MAGIAQAYADNIPVLVFLGGNNLERLSVKPNFTAPTTIGAGSSRSKRSIRRTRWAMSCAVPSTPCATAGLARSWSS
jgi:hypothetical protein